MEKSGFVHVTQTKREQLCYNAQCKDERTEPVAGRGSLQPRQDVCGWDLCLEVIMMVKQVKVSNFTEVKGIVSAAAKCYNDVGVHDMKGSIADAKSILGMMSLDYSHPVKIVCENEHDLNSVVNALKQ